MTILVKLAHRIDTMERLKREENFVIENHMPEEYDRYILEEIRRGLMSNPKEISSKFFYDKKGSKLFEMICDLDEYYLTRTEVFILRKYMEDIVKDIRDVDIIELVN